MDPEVEALWERYQEAGDPDVREQLILQYSPLVKYVAGRVAVGMPPHVEVSDLVSYGIFGLMDAIEKFDPERGYKFETYAISRIRGSIIDELRANDWVPRSVRSKASRIQNAVTRLQAELQRSPTEEEIAQELEISMEELGDMLSATSYTSMVALDQLLDVGEDSGVRLVDTIEDDSVPSPDESLDDQELKARLRETIQRLPEREQTVLALYYFEGLTLRQVGDILGVTESRICQIHSKAVLSMRAEMEKQVTG